MNLTKVGRKLLGVIALISLSACEHRQMDAGVNAGDLLHQARVWRVETGLAAARDRLVTRLGEMDASQGSLESRVWRTNGDKDFVFPDSLSTLDHAQRARTGIFLVLGYRTKAGTSERVIREVEAYLKREGWHAVLVEVKERGTTSEDAAAIQATLRRDLPQVDRAILVGFSKGGLDLMRWAAERAGDLHVKELKKIRLMVNFAGALRGSAVADWLADGGGPVAGTLRLMARSNSDRETERLADIRSIGEDPWEGQKVPNFRALGTDLRHVGIVAIPEGENGLTHVDRGFSVVNRLVTVQWRTLGPMDGFVESAAQVLPSEAGVPQHIVRVLGSHAVLDGRYLNGGIVSKKYLNRSADFWRGGEELLDDLMRALPLRWVWGRP